MTDINPTLTDKIKEDMLCIIQEAIAGLVEPSYEDVASLIRSAYLAGITSVWVDDEDNPTVINAIVRFTIPDRVQ